MTSDCCGARARAPQQSDVIVVAFNNTASQLGGKGWKRGGDALALERVLKDLETIIPEGSTNLQAGLTEIAAAISVRPA